MTRWPNFFLPLVYVILLTLAILSKGIYDTGDGLMHYLFARYAPQHPGNLLDHWAKPLYTLLAMPFAQFGYNGVVAFNLLCSCLSAWLAWKTAERLKIPFAAWAAPLSLFAPIALPVALSGLTEPLFSLLLMYGIFLTVKGRFGIAAIVISFLPFVRTEGFFLAPFFGLFFLLRRDYISIALLALGTIVYSIIGGIALGDFLWIIHRNPYTGAETIYGHGSPGHFLEANEFIWGWGLDVLIVCGLVVYLLPKKFNAQISLAEKLLVPGIFLGFLILHSTFWWKGLFGSLGMIRVMVCTMPLAAIMSLRGLQVFGRFISSRKVMIGFCMAVFGLQAWLTIRQHPLPFRPRHSEMVMQQLKDSTQGKVYAGVRIIASHPMLAHIANRDPFDIRQWKEFNTIDPQDGFMPGDIVIWDSHFSCFDKQIPLESMQQNKLFGEMTHFGELQKSRADEGDTFGLWVFVVK